MSEKENEDNHRGSPRATLDGTVKVRFDEATLEGPGQNLSKDGVYLIADGEILLEIQPGQAAPIEHEGA